MKDVRTISTQSYALGIPSKARQITPYDDRELACLLGFPELQEYDDVETPGEAFLMFKREVENLDKMVELIKFHRAELIKIFAPEIVDNREDLGFWRILWRTNAELEIPVSRLQLSETHHGPHYRLEYRSGYRVLRAKGRSLRQTIALFGKAINREI